MFRFCPSCGLQNIRFEEEKKFYCPDCGFVYYHNTAAATGCVIDNGQGILFLTRGEEPAKGKLDLPGGFVEPGEGVISALLRECQEEIGWLPDAANVRLYASFPNTYPYKNIIYRTCDLFFAVQAPELHIKDLQLQKEEISSCAFIAYNQIDFESLAFDSTKRAIQAYKDVLL